MVVMENLGLSDHILETIRNLIIVNELPDTLDVLLEVLTLPMIANI